MTMVIEEHDEAGAFLRDCEQAGIDAGPHGALLEYLTKDGRHHAAIVQKVMAVVRADASLRVRLQRLGGPLTRLLAEHARTF